MLAKVLSRPELTEEAEPYYFAFAALNPYRPMQAGFGVAFPLPIPRELIERQGERLGFEGGELDEFVDIVAAVDHDFIKRTAEQTRNETLARGKG